MSEYKKSHKLILDKADQADLGEVTVKQFMNKNCIKLKPNYTIKATIETFRIHHISGAPVVDFQDKIIGVISEYDLLIQAATGPMTAPISYKNEITSVYLETQLKEVLKILYKQKLKWMPVVNKENFIQGVISRIDVLNFIASHSE
ncbi:MAG: CBS domain-containing protein [Bacteriovorax sp.]|jgi:predicted transcriptional regulator